MNIIEFYNKPITIEKGMKVIAYASNTEKEHNIYEKSVGKTYTIDVIRKCGIMGNTTSYECKHCRTNKSAIYLQDDINRHYPICGCYLKLKTEDGIDIDTNKGGRKICFIQNT